MPEPDVATPATAPPEKRFNVAVFYLAVALLLAVVYAVSFSLWPPGKEVGPGDLVRHAILALGTAVLAAGIVHTGVTKWAVRDLGDEAKKSLERAIGGLRVLDGCARGKVDNVFPVRSEFYRYLATKVLPLLGPRDVVQIAGISLRDFFGGASDDGSAHILRDEFDRSIKRGVRYRLCLLDPRSDAGAQRAFREEKGEVEYISKTGLFGDVYHAVNHYLRLEDGDNPKNESLPQVNCPRAGAQRAGWDRQWRPNCKWGSCGDCRRSLCMALYETSPHCFLLILPEGNDEGIFVEQYHYGRPGDQRKGGQFPMLQLGRDALSADLLRGHFEYVWCGGRLVTSLVQDELNARRRADEDRADEDKEKQQKGDEGAGQQAGDPANAVPAGDQDIPTAAPG